MTRLLNLIQVSEILNKELKTLYDYCVSGKLDCAFKIGHEWRVKEDDLWEWIERQKLNNGLVKTAR